LREFANYLEFLKPDVVHFHHLLNLGLEALHLTRAVLPRARIVVTLHDYYLICANNGQLFKHHANERCMGPSLRSCAACLPKVAAEDLRMRELDIRRTLDLVDHLVSPSQFLAGRIEAGIANCPPVAVVHNTYVGPGAAPAARRTERNEFVFSYFGNLSRVKGAGDLLAAAGLLLERGVTRFGVQVNGAQLYEDAAFDQQLDGARMKLGTRLAFLGRYEQNEVAARMAEADCVVFPSLWWENAPLVIYEALHHRKRVLAYPHGGAAEILKRHGQGVFAANSRPDGLADAMRQILESGAAEATPPDPPLQSMAQFAAAYEDIYTGISTKRLRQLLPSRAVTG